MDKKQKDKDIIKETAELKAEAEDLKNGWYAMEKKFDELIERCNKILNS